jgi:signal transduction histidine kinase
MSSLSAPAGFAPRVRLSIRAAPASWATLALGAAAIGIYFLLPSNPQSIGYVVIGVCTVACVAAGTLRNLARGRRLAWWLFTAGLALQVAGDTVFGVYEVAFNREPPFPGLADGFYLAGYPLIALGAFVVLRNVAGQFTPSAALDSVVVFLGVALVQWVFFIDPYNHQHLTRNTRLVEMAYPAMDALLLMAIGQFAIMRGNRTSSARLLILSLCLWVIADEAYTLGIASYRGGSWIDALWLGSYVCWAAAALDPSVGRVTVTGRKALPRLTPMRIALLSAALLMSPAILIFEKAARHRVHLSVGIFGVLMSVAVLWRLSGLLRIVDSARLSERSARREAELAQRLLRLQNEQLRELDRLKDEFVSSVSHELRTPLTSISGYAELLVDDESSTERLDYLKIIQRNADRLLGLVSDILFAARLQDGRLTLDVEPIEIERVVRQAVEDAKPRADAANVELSADIETGAVVNGESDRLSQLLDNLISNAIKFTPPGGRVRVAVVVEDGVVRLDVSDTGVGISEEDRQRLFERFFRSQTALERQIQGTGLGLYISKAIVEAHSGRIGVAMGQGEGTTFVVELPVAI